MLLFAEITLIELFALWKKFVDTNKNLCIRWVEEAIERIMTTTSFVETTKRNFRSY